MGKVISLHAERWVEGVFDETGVEGGLRVDVSTKGRVRFVHIGPNVNIAEQGIYDVAEAVVVDTLTMEQMARLSEALSVAYREDEDG